MPSRIFVGTASVLARAPVSERSSTPEGIEQAAFVLAQQAVEFRLKHVAKPAATFVGDKPSHGLMRWK